MLLRVPPAFHHLSRNTQAPPFASLHSTRSPRHGALRIRCVLGLTVVGLLVMGLVGSAQAQQPFPKYGILPKQETGALEFLKGHPQYDGRGVVVAIFDTGVDPGVAALQTTTTGEPKIVDLIDGSGSGDVDTTTRRPVKGGQVEGLSGRKLRIPAAWKIPRGEVHLGVKAAYDFYPARLVQRLKKERRREFENAQRAAVVEAAQDLRDYDAMRDKDKASSKSGPDTSKPAAPDERRQELEARKSQLQLAMADYDDPGPIFDCVVFYDGDAWRAVVDTDEDGDLQDESLLTNFRDERCYGTFGEEDLLNFALNIYDEGNLLSIVTDCGTHGTHVASIVAGHHPEQPEYNGVAPGAQIVSVKIGDPRVGSSSTGTGEVRGLIAALEHDCDLINMSYGGATSDPNRGRISELYTEIVREHGVIFVASAGNSGPALSTVVSPGGTNSAILGIGAYVSPEMMEVGYALREKLGEMPYTWTSRGPTLDGALGVDLCAPGGAIAGVSNWSLDRSALMNGTSMSSPNACGAIALLLSGLKANGIEYSPASVRRALENTTRSLEDRDVFAQGQGLIQIPAAWDALTRDPTAENELLGYDLRVSGDEAARGIYLRDPQEIRGVLERQVRVTPVYPPGAKNRDRSAFQFRLQLQSTADWLECPDFLLMANSGKAFQVRVDPGSLDAGVHYAEVQGFDPDRPERGPLFRLPVTVVRPEPPSNSSPKSPPNSARYRWSRTLHFAPGELQRFFIEVPAGATWADLAIRGGDLEAPRRVVAHAIQRLPRRGYPRSYQRHFLTVRREDEQVRSFPVVGGHTLELCLGQYWSSLGESELAVELEFHGLMPSTPILHLQPGQLSTRVEVTAPLRAESLAPEVTLNWVRRVLRPTTSELRPLTAERDELPDSRRIHQLVLTYNLDLPESFEVRLSSALAHQDEAGKSFESGLWSIHDAAKQIVKQGQEQGSAKLSKGRYTIRFHLRHDEAALLQKLEPLAFYVDLKLAKPIKLSIHSDPDGVFAAAAFGTRRIECGQRAVFYVAAPPRDKLPDAVGSGHLLLGEMTLGAENKTLQGRGRRPEPYPVRCGIIGTSNGAGGSAPDPYEPSRLIAQLAKELDDAELRDQVERLDQARIDRDEPRFEQLLARLEQAEPEAAQLAGRLEKLYWLDTKDRKQWLPDVVRAADAAMKKIPKKKLARQLARRAAEPAGPTDQAEQARWKLRKQILTDTLYRKGRAIAFMDLPPKNEEGIDEQAIPKFPETLEAREKAFEANFAELQQWVDTTEPEWALLHIRRERRHERPARALEVLRDYLPRVAPEARLNRKRVDCYKELGWDHWHEYEQRWMLRRFPPAYPAF